MKSVGIGPIGTGFMGQCHAMAFGAVTAAFGDVPRPRLEFLCDPDPEVAHLLRGLEGRETLYPNLGEAPHIERVVHGVIPSSSQGVWTAVNDA